VVKITENHLGALLYCLVHTIVVWDKDSVIERRTIVDEVSFFWLNALVDSGSKTPDPLHGSR